MGVRSTKWGFLSFCQAINKSLCALLLYLSYNEVGWLTVRGLGAWPGACINSTTSATSPLSPSLFLSLPSSLSSISFRFWTVSLALLILFQPSFPTPQHPPLPPPPSILHALVSSPRLPASTHQRSAPMRARSPGYEGYERREFGDLLYYPLAARV